MSDPTPPVFLINLDRDTQKLAAMEAQLAERGVGFTRVPAVLGKGLSAAELARWRPDPHYWRERRNFHLGEVGNVLSHRKILERIVGEKHALAAVLEDDVGLSEDFRQVLADLARNMHGCEAIKLEGLEMHGSPGYVRPLASLGGRTLYFSFRPALGCAGYLVTHRGAQKLLAALDHVHEPFDHTLAAFARHDLRLAELRPFPAWQREGLSEISASRANLAHTPPDLSYRLRKRWEVLSTPIRTVLFDLRQFGWRALKERPVRMLAPQNRQEHVARAKDEHETMGNA
ncbi:MAG: glycosyltransferase family 25 protein [Alphaproteobacteria bacterium]|nr:glycosyltransferase family 25 protein [Alphaproteobacteria bacterium]